MAMRPAPEMYPVTQNFYADATAYNYGAGHGAVDIGVPPGTPLVAPEDGVVLYDGWVWDLPGGPYDYHLRWYLIKPDRGDVHTGGGIVTVFENPIGSDWYIAHAGESFYNVGDRISKGDVLQLSGNTGSSTGPHSHVGLFPPVPDWGNGFFGGIDPAPYLTEKYQPTRRVSWQGGPTEGVGATVIEGDWLDMATEAEVRRIVAEETRKAVIRELTYPRQKQGPHAGGTVSLQDEILHLASNFAIIARAVSPAAISAAVAHGVGAKDAEINVDELAQKVAQQLLAAIITPTTEQEA